jgi:ParB-like chromosome segregation protein Spo0J
MLHASEQRFEYRLPLKQLIADHSINISRAGERHDPAYAKQLAERMLDTGQTTPIEVFRFPDDPIADADPWRIAAGFGRWEGATFAVEKGLLTASFDGNLRAVEVPRELLAGKTKAEIIEIIQNRNLDENIHRHNLSPIDEALAINHLATPADKGGRGEDLRLIGQRMHKTGEQIHKMRKLVQLGESARHWVREHFRDKELGINEVQAYKLANKTVEEQDDILNKAKDASGRVIPKAVQSVINPHSGRQGQPEVVTGASLTLVSARLERVLKTKSELTKNQVTSEQVDLTIKLLTALRDRTDEAFKALPGKLGQLVKNELSKS